MKAFVERCLTPPRGSDLVGIFNEMLSGKGIAYHPRYELNPGRLVTDTHRVAFLEKSMTWERLIPITSDGATGPSWPDYFQGRETLDTKGDELLKGKQKTRTQMLPLEKLETVFLTLLEKAWPTLNGQKDVLLRRIKERATEIYANSNKVRHLGPIAVAPATFFRQLVDSRADLVIPIQGQKLEGWEIEKFLTSFKLLVPFLDAGRNLVYVINPCPSDRRLANKDYRLWMEYEALYRAAMEYLALRNSRVVNQVAWFVPINHLDQEISDNVFKNPAVVHWLEDHPNSFPKTSTDPISYSAGITDCGEVAYMVDLKENLGYWGAALQGKPMVPVVPEENDDVTSSLLKDLVRAARESKSECHGWRRLTIPDFLGLPKVRVSAQRSHI